MGGFSVITSSCLLNIFIDLKLVKAFWRNIEDEQNQNSNSIHCTWSSVVFLKTKKRQNSTLTEGGSIQLLSNPPLVFMNCYRTKYVIIHTR